jgi:hypothetical protein
VTSEIRQKRFQRLHLKAEEGVELPVGETTKRSLPRLELHRHLTQRDRQGGEDLARIAFSDPPLGQRSQPEDPIRESFGRHRQNPQAGAPVGEIVNRSGSDS